MRNCFTVWKNAVHKNIGVAIASCWKAVTPILSFDGPVAETYSRMVVELKRMGRPRPAVDLMIAATARHHGLAIATLNVRHFQGIPGVVIEDWGKV
jgi:predicted nucleic acid-binding protein